MQETFTQENNSVSETTPSFHGGLTCLMTLPSQLQRSPKTQQLTIRFKAAAWQPVEQIKFGALPKPCSQRTVITWHTRWFSESPTGKAVWTKVSLQETHSGQKCPFPKVIVKINQRQLTVSRCRWL